MKVNICMAVLMVVAGLMDFSASLSAATTNRYMCLDNFGARAQPGMSKASKQPKLKVPVSITTKTMVKYFMDRKHEYKEGQGTVTLIRNGKPQMVIVVSDKAPAPVRYAGKELKFFLDKISGGNFQIVNKIPVDGRAIILGNTPQARTAGINVNKIARDGYRIIAKDNSIIIAGKDDSTEQSEILFSFMDAPDSNSKGILYKTLHADLWTFQRGTLYGVYRLLEKLGVRWFLPGPKGEVVPFVKNLEISTFNMPEEPAFDLRRVGPSVWGGPDLLRRYNKLKKSEFKVAYSDLKLTAKENRLWVLRMRGSSTIYPMSHRVYDDFVKRFGDTHPEYFALYRGKRDLPQFGATGRYGLPCFSSEGRFKETLKDIDAFFSGKPTTARGIKYRYPGNRGWSSGSDYGNIVSLLPPDAFKPCSCKLCKSRIAMNRSGGQNSEVVWGFTAKVAEEVQKRWPGKMVSQLAYSAHSKLPLTLDQLPDNILVGICPSGLNKTYNIIAPKRYDELFTIIKEWNNMSVLPVTFWFHHLFRHGSNFRESHYGVPMLVPHFFGRLVKDLSKYGRVMFMEMDCDNYMFEHLNRYVLLKLLYSPDLNVDDLIDDYVNKFYGPAATIIKSMLSDIETRCELIAISEADRWEIWSKSKFFSPEVMNRYRKDADEAVKVTIGTPYAEATRLFSKYFIGFMEKGYKEAAEVTLNDKQRSEMLLKRANLCIKLPHKKNLSFELMAAIGYQNFQKSIVNLSRDDKYLNIELSAHESKIDKLKTDCKTNNKGPICLDDSFEIMLVPPDSKSYYQIIVNSFGAYSVINAGGEVGQDMIKSSKFKLQVSSDILYDEDGEWRVKVKIPLSQFPGSDFKKVWRLNIFRNRHLNIPDAYQASGICLSKVNFHILKEYPKLYWMQK